jgi:TolC family type I secretion outer membrane protein
MKTFLILLASLIFDTVVSSNEVYISDDLSESLGNLYDYNPKIKYEREILKSKDELLPRAFSNFRPEISGYYQKGKVDTVSKGFNITSDGIRTETNKGVIVSQNIFDGGSSFSEIQISKNEIFSQRFYLRNIEQEVFLEGIKLYAEFATESSNLILKKKNVEVLKRQLELTKEQFEIGEVTMTDVSIAEARFSLAESESLESTNNLNSLKANFFSMFGKGPNTPKIEMPLKKSHWEIDELKRKALENNPKIKGLKYKIKSYEKQIQSLKRKQLPSVKLEAEAKINEGYFRTDSKREVLSAFAKIDIPIYRSGLASSEIRGIRKQATAEIELLKLEKKNLESNLITSKSSLDYSFSKINALKKQIESNKIYLEGLKQELQLGERTTLDVLNGEQELLESSLGLVMAFKDYFISYYELFFHLGKLNAKDLNLNVILFDDEKNYNAVKGKWLDIIE